MKILVQEFGEQCFTNYEDMIHICNFIKKNKGNNKLVVVISANCIDGNPYSSNALLNLCHHVNKNVDSKTIDMITSCSNVINGVLFTSLLQKQELNSVYLTGEQIGIITNDNYTKANIMNIKIEKIKDMLSKDNVVVISAYQGLDNNKQVTTITQNCKFISALSLGKALKANKVDLFEDLNDILNYSTNIK